MRKTRRQRISTRLLREHGSARQHQQEPSIIEHARHRRSATNLVPQAVALLKKRFPQIRVNIEMEFSGVLVQRLQDGKLDMIVARIRNPDDLVELHYVPLAEAQHALFARVGHPLIKRKTLSWNELAPQTWILPPKGNVMRNRFTQLFLERQLALPTDVVASSSLPVITSLLQMSDMIAPLAREPVRPYCIAGTLEPRPFELDLKLGPAGIVTRRRQALTRCPSDAADAARGSGIRHSEHRCRQPLSHRSKASGAA